MASLKEWKRLEEAHNLANCRFGNAIVPNPK